MTAYRYPDAQERYLGSLPPSEPKMTSHDVICVHTMVGTLWGTDAFFHDQGWSGTESHYGTGFDGETLEWCPLDHQADANLNGNPYVISIENADKGEGFPEWTGSNVPTFTAAQINRLVDLIDRLCSPEAHVSCPSSWQCHKVGIPRVVIPDTKPGRRGIGWHRQGIDPWRVSGGVKWSNSDGKVCPGDRRVDQIVNEIVPRVAAKAQPAPEPPNAEESDMLIVTNPAGQSLLVLGGEGTFGMTATDKTAYRDQGDIKEVTVSDDGFARFKRLPRLDQ